VIQTVFKRLQQIRLCAPDTHNSVLLTGVTKPRQCYYTLI